jgi:tetratricopeptide (TPR) repeat protein
MVRVTLAVTLLVTGTALAAQAVMQGQDGDFTKGVEDLKQQNWQGAIASFHTSLKMHPGRADTLFYLSQAYYLNGQVQEALATIAEAVRLEPQNAAAEQKYGEYLCEARQYSRGLDALLDARRLDASLDHIDFDIGMAYYRVSVLKEAIRNLELALARDPANADAAFFLAECYSIKYDWPRAEKMYRRVLADGKLDGATYHGLGVAVLHQGDPSAALALFQKALTADPSLVETHYVMARALRALGRSEEADHQIEVFKAVRLATDAPAALPRLTDPDQEAFWAACQRLLERKREDEALELLRSADPKRSYYLLGTLYYSMGRFKDAQRILDIALANSPRDAGALAWMARTELAEGKLPEAEARFRRVLEMDPENQLGLAGMGAIRHAQHRWAESARWLERSRSREPAALLDLCDDYLKLGRRKDAELVAELVRSFGAGDRAVETALEKLLHSD